MYLVSGTYLEDCESRTTQNEPPTSVIQTQTSPQTDTPQTDTTQNVSQHNIENSIGDGFHCDHMLGNNKLCGQKFDSAQNLENHKISTHSPAGPSKTMTETVTEAALRVDKDANLEMAKKIIVNAKLRNTSICGATETLLIHKNKSKKVIELLVLIK